MFRYQHARTLGLRHDSDFLSPSETSDIRKELSYVLRHAITKANSEAKPQATQRWLVIIERYLNELHRPYQPLDPELSWQLLNLARSVNYTFAEYNLVDLSKNCLERPHADVRTVLQCLADYYFTHPYSNERNPANLFDILFKYLIRALKENTNDADIAEFHRLLQKENEVHVSSLLSYFTRLPITYHTKQAWLVFPQNVHKPLADYLPTNRYYLLFFASEMYMHNYLNNRSQPSVHANMRLFSHNECPHLLDQLISLIDDYVDSIEHGYKLTSQELDIIETLTGSIFKRIADPAKTALQLNELNQSASLKN